MKTGRDRPEKVAEVCWKTGRGRPEKVAEAKRKTDGDDRKNLDKEM